ncbi:MAG TPA: hypothetical protein ENJ80_02950 [Gammaproteobacteria bacterium]|nr:hypothetical protein [Gammaproteobacteria bacterium]
MVRYGGNTVMQSAEGVDGASEASCFRTPWHWYMHGIGLGYGAAAHDSDRAERLLRAARALCTVADTPFHTFTYKLLLLVTGCRGLDASAPDAADSRAAVDVGLFRLQGNPLHYIAMSALFVDCLARLDRLGGYRHTARRHLDLALRVAGRLPENDDRARYLKLQLLSRLFMAVARAGWTERLLEGTRGQTSYFQRVLQLAGRIDNRFLGDRALAILLAVIGLSGYARQVGRDIERRLGELFDGFEQQLRQLPDRSGDGVHSGQDYLLFPLSLTLGALPALGLQRYTDYGRNWVDAAVALFGQLTPRSRASQVLFLVSALEGLGRLDDCFPDRGQLIETCADAYLAGTDGLQMDDYLRCTYLVHLACQYGDPERLDTRIWDILAGALLRPPGQHTPGQYNKYGATFMRAAYVLSAIDRAGRLETLYGSGLLLPERLGRLQLDPQALQEDSPRLCLALIDAGLRKRPAGGDAGE